MHPAYSKMTSQQKDSTIRMMRTRIIDLMLADVTHDVEEQALRDSVDNLRREIRLMKYGEIDRIVEERQLQVEIDTLKSELSKCLKIEPGAGNGILGQPYFMDPWIYKIDPDPGIVPHWQQWTDTSRIWHSLTDTLGARCCDTIYGTGYVDTAYTITPKSFTWQNSTVPAIHYDTSDGEGMYIGHTFAQARDPYHTEVHWILYVKDVRRRWYRLGLWRGRTKKKDVWIVGDESQDPKIQYFDRHHHRLPSYLSIKWPD